ncbi:uncharacterized protein LOC8279198 isoform X3 [Ricinus communis]|uniref:uncharacterized protein LOC8279198 isoform X3 n=1 Tax=Ricinus communis TaxID=3988 RepID=UPI0007725614|nr:uncharacterized protein LOC8279198 isoform X3 [Ricinus communis]|eukprot:XP_015574171.1 uncharacterized protein LOC8279198 isoform X3 [Ricinus communis]
MALSLPRKWKNSIFFTSTLTPNLKVNGFRSKSALEAIAKAREEEKIQTLVLYNYPSFSGAFSALFAHLFHSNFNLPHLILPFSSVHPFSVQDFCFEGLERCYLFDFLGPPGFASMLSKKTMCQVLGFDHRKSLLSRISSIEECPENVTFHVDVEKSSSSVVYEYYSNRLIDMKSPNGAVARLLNPEDQDRVEMVLKYVEDVDIRRWSLPDIRAFSVGLSEWRSKLNCITNPFIFEEGVRADGNSNLSDEIGRQLSVKSAEAGLRPMGAVVYLQRNNLKMCLRSTDNATDTSEVAKFPLLSPSLKAYGGGGSRSSSSFIIRMDEYNRWLSDSPS